MIPFSRRAFAAIGCMFALLALAATPARSADEKKIAIACVGDSITAGSGAGAGNSYPDQLGTLLGTGYVVKNFGVSGATLMNHAERPYQKQGAFKQALGSSPDIVIIMLGTNDTKAQNWKFKDEFYEDYKGLIEQFRKLDSKPRIFVCTPCPVVDDGKFGIQNSGVDELIPVIRKLGTDLNLGVIDMHEALAKPVAANPKLIPDNVHPGKEGHTLMAKAAQAAVTAKVAATAPATRP